MIRITGVPEHFNYPWLKVVESQPFLDEDIKLEWENEPRGSGAMNKAITDGDADIAIILTESFIKDKIEGNPGKIIGFHVRSPLVWGIHISGKSPIKDMDELKNAPFLISRFGSGSHLMAYLLAEREGWDLSALEFEVVGNLEGAKKALQSSLPKIFLWEKFTTKPLVDNGTFKRIDEILTPWPCFVIVASKEIHKNKPLIIQKLRNLVYNKSSDLLTNAGYSSILSEYYQLQKSDVEAWLSQTSWAKDSKIDRKELENVMHILKKLDVVSKSVHPEELISKELVQLI